MDQNQIDDGMDQSKQRFYKKTWVRGLIIAGSLGAVVYLFSKVPSALPGRHETAVNFTKAVISRPEKGHLNTKQKLVSTCAIFALTIGAIYICPVNILMIKKIGFRVGYHIACRTIWQKYNLSPIVIIEENAGVPQFVTFVIYATPWDEKNGISFLHGGLL